MSDFSGMWSLKIGDPCVERTPATSFRSLIGIGMPASAPRSATGSFISRSAWARARSKQSVGSALTGAVDRGDALLQRVEQVVRRHLPALQAVHDGQGIGADQVVAHSIFPQGFQGIPAASSVLASARGAVHGRTAWEKCFTSCRHDHGPIRERHRPMKMSETRDLANAARARAADQGAAGDLPEAGADLCAQPALDAADAAARGRRVLAHASAARRQAGARARAPQRHARRAGPGG